MRMGIFSLAAALGCLASVSIAAPTPPPDGVWTGKGQAGLVSTQGNSSAKTANVALDLSLVHGAWKHSAHLGGLYAQSAGITSADRWDALWQSNYLITTRVLAFGTLRYSRDMFSGFQYQASAAAGIGYKLFDGKTIHLTVQGGAGYRRTQPENILRNSAGLVSSRTLLAATGNAILTAGVDYSQDLTGTTTLSDKLLIESGSSDTLVNDALALTVKISTKLALSVGYRLQNNSKPPAGLKKLDTMETIDLVYAF